MELKAVKKIKPYTKHWEKLANELARTWKIINPCKHCGHPVLEGYCCSFCGSSDPR